MSQFGGQRVTQGRRYGDSDSHLRRNSSTTQPGQWSFDEVVLLKLLLLPLRLFRLLLGLVLLPFKLLAKGCLFGVAGFIGLVLLVVVIVVVILLVVLR